MTNNHIDYIEFKAGDLQAVKKFYTKCFQWEFTDYGPDYTAFENSGVSGGFERSDTGPSAGALIVLYHKDLIKIRDVIFKGAIKNRIRLIFYFVFPKWRFKRAAPFAHQFSGEGVNMSAFPNYCEMQMREFGKPRLANLRDCLAFAYILFGFDGD